MYINCLERTRLNDFIGCFHHSLCLFDYDLTISRIEKDKFLNTTKKINLIAIILKEYLYNEFKNKKQSFMMKLPEIFQDNHQYIFIKQAYSNNYDVYAKLNSNLNTQNKIGIVELISNYKLNNKIADFFEYHPILNLQNKYKISLVI